MTIIPLFLSPQILLCAQPDFLPASLRPFLALSVMTTLEESDGRHGSDRSPGNVVSPAPPSRAKTRTRRAARGECFWFILRIDVVRCHTDSTFPACLSCRARKVRCDVVSQYPKSCNNCHLDQIECAVPNTKRCAVSSFLACCLD